MAAVVALSLARRDPRIQRVRYIDDPATVEVSGEHFGTGGRLEIDGLAVAREDIQSWTEDRIVFRVAAGRTSGLLRVQTDGGVSNAVFLTVQADIPTVTREDLARIESLSPTTIGPGTVLRVLGFGFGPRSALAEIGFTTAASGETITVNGISSWIVHWSNREIRVVVPPGIGGGPQRISINGETLREETVGALIDLSGSIGDTRTIAVHRRIRIGGLDPATIASGVEVVMPQVPVTTGQGSVQLLREDGERLGTIGDAAWLYRVTPPSVPRDEQEGDPPVTIERTDYVERNALRFRLPEELPTVDSAVLANDDFRTAFTVLLGAVDGMRPTDPVISQIGEEVLSGYRNPLAIARQIHDQVVQRLEPAPEAGTSLKEAVLRGRGSARNYADLTVLLARWAGIPARRQIGVYLDEDNRTRHHAWVEFFIPGFGWLPADPAISDGIYRPRTEADGDAEVDAEAYSDSDADSNVSTFGFLDDRRISLYVDGTPPARVQPGTVRLEPPDPYAPGLQWVALPADIDPEKREAITVEWIAPEIIPY